MHQTQQTTNNITTITPTKINKSAMIRELLASGVPPTQVALDVGCKPQYVYGVMAYERSRQKKAKAKAKRERDLTKLNAPKRKYVKSGKYSKKAAAVPAAPIVSAEEMEALKQIPLETPAPVTEIRYVAVDVPQPHYNLTWKQRFTALFFGRV